MADSCRFEPCLSEGSSPLFCRIGVVHCVGGWIVLRLLPLSLLSKTARFESAAASKTHGERDLRCYWSRWQFLHNHGRVGQRKRRLFGTKRRPFRSSRRPFGTKGRRWQQTLVLTTETQPPVSFRWSNGNSILQSALNVAINRWAACYPCGPRWPRPAELMVESL